MQNTKDTGARELFFVELLGSLTILFIWVISLYFLKDTPGYKNFIKILSYTFVVYVTFNILNEEVLSRFIHKTVLLVLNIFIFTLILEGISLATGIPFNRLNYLLIFPVVISAYFLGPLAGAGFSILTILLFALTHIYFFTSKHGVEFQEIFFYSTIYFFTDIMLIAIAAYVRENIKKTREKLKKAEISKERILESIPSGVLVLDSSKNPIYINPHATTILKEISIEEFIKKITEQSSSLHNQQDKRREIAIGARIIGYSIRTLPDNERIIIFQDLTEIKKLEREKELNKKLIALGEMSAQLAHEIRNPLTSIITASELLKEPGANQNLLVEKIIEGAERLNRLISEFLSFTRITGVKKEKINLSPLLTEITERFKWQYPNIRFELDIPDELLVLGESGLLNSVFENIIQNSVEALSERDEKLIKIMAQKSPEHVIISISDTGEGMDKETIKKIFDPFFTTKTYGTGLGLSLVRKILSYHNAEIKIKSEKNSGTTVEIIFPGIH